MNDIPEFVLDGASINNLDEMAAEISRLLGFSRPWRGDLDALDDCLYGGMGAPMTFRLLWLHSEVSKERLGYGETVRWYEHQLHTAHERNISLVRKRLEEVRNRRGSTLFEKLVEIIRSHPNIQLQLR